MNRALLIICLLSILVSSCRKDPVQVDPEPTPYDLVVPDGFSPPYLPASNPLTEEGVELGRYLFYEERLSGNNTMSCATCHMQQYGFGENTRFSVGITNDTGTINAMPLFNLAWGQLQQFFWDGRAHSLENQALGPVVNPIEMNESWTNAAEKLSDDPAYRELFIAAFGDATIDSTRITMALAQFMRTLISGNSPFDRYLNERTTPLDIPTGINIWGNLDTFLFIWDGYNAFIDEQAGDCGHCHNDPYASRVTTDFDFKNNGLDLVPDPGLGAVTLSPFDSGKFKTPSVRNLGYTAPYMHDGRFATIDEVLEFYALHVEGNSPNIDGNMFYVDGQSGSGAGAQLTVLQRQQVRRFLQSLNDPDLVTNPAFQDPGPPINIS